MRGGRLFWASFVCLLVAAGILAVEGKSLSVTNAMSLSSAAFSVAAVVLGVLSLRRR